MRSRVVTQILIALTLLGGNCLVSWHLYNLESEQIYSEFQGDIDKRVYALENELLETRAMLRHWQSFYEAAGEVSPSEFSQIATSVLETSPALQLLAWAPRVTREQRPLIEQQFQKQNPAFRFFEIDPRKIEPAGKVDDESLRQQIEAFDARSIFRAATDKAEYFPITMIEPQELAGAITGMDASSVGRIQFSSALKKSIATHNVVGLPATPNPFDAKHEPMILALVPIYTKESTAGNIEVRGIISTAFGVKELLAYSRVSDMGSDTNFILQDLTGDDGLRTLYKMGEIDTRKDLVYRVRLMEAFERKWTLVASPKPSYIEARRSALPWVILIGGALFSALLVGYITLVQRQAKLVQIQVEQRTIELKSANEELNIANNKLEELSRVDPLTGTANRRFFNESLEKEWQRALRDQSPIALLLIDVDHFKAYNDFYGHLRGDDCLVEVAAALRHLFNRSGDLVARYGGEEFAIVLPNAGGEAMRVAERCRAVIEALNIAHEKSETADHVTISVGMSSVIPSPDLASNILIESADRGLYIAKGHGRNRVIYHTCSVNLLRTGTV